MSVPAAVPGQGLRRCDAPRCWDRSRNRAYRVSTKNVASLPPIVATSQLAYIDRARGDLDAALGRNAEEIAIDFQIGDSETIRETDASAIELAETAGEVDQAAAWRETSPPSIE